MSSACVAAPALDFLRCRTPDAWVLAAIGDVDLLLQDHATLELKAAEQAQRLIRRYGASRDRGAAAAGGLPGRLIAKMSRLAREELRHFEQVVDHLAARGLGYRPVSASRYASALHAAVRRDEPGRLVDTLLVGAIIEARSCERFASLAPALEPVDPVLAKFYRSLLRSEARHYQDYLALAEAAAAPDPVAVRAPQAAPDPRDPPDAAALDPAAAALAARLDTFLDLDRDLVLRADSDLRFHSGMPALQ